MSHIDAIRHLTERADALREDRSRAAHLAQEHEANASLARVKVFEYDRDITKLEHAIDTLQQDAAAETRRFAEVIGVPIPSIQQGQGVAAVGGTLYNAEHGEPGSEATA